MSMEALDHVIRGAFEDFIEHVRLSTNQWIHAKQCVESFLKHHKIDCPAYQYWTNRLSVNGCTEPVPYALDILNNAFNKRKEPAMKFDPVTGNEIGDITDPDEYRGYHGKVAWLYNPYTGTSRDPRDIGSDVTGLLIQP